MELDVDLGQDVEEGRKDLEVVQRERLTGKGKVMETMSVQAFSGMGLACLI